MQDRDQATGLNGAAFETSLALLNTSGSTAVILASTAVGKMW